MDKNSSLYKTVLLGVVCAIAGALLSAVNAVTAPIIEENAMAGIKSSLEEIYPDVTDFKDITDDYVEDDDSLIDGIYQAGDKGYIFTLHNTGYEADGFKIMIGFNNDGTISGYTALEQKETSGKGSKAFEDPYVSDVLKLTADDEMPLISGATITSTAVQTAVKEAASVFKTITGGK